MVGSVPASSFLGLAIADIVTAAALANSLHTSGNAVGAGAGSDGKTMAWGVAWGGRLKDALTRIAEVLSFNTPFNPTTPASSHAGAGSS